MIGGWIVGPAALSEVSRVVIYATLMLSQGCYHQVSSGGFRPVTRNVYAQEEVSASVE